MSLGQSMLTFMSLCQCEPVSIAVTLHVRCKYSFVHFVATTWNSAYFGPRGIFDIYAGLNTDITQVFWPVGVKMICLTKKLEVKSFPFERFSEISSGTKPWFPMTATISAKPECLHVLSLTYIDEHDGSAHAKWYRESVLWSSVNDSYSFKQCVCTNLKIIH